MPGPLAGAERAGLRAGLDLEPENNRSGAEAGSERACHVQRLDFLVTRLLCASWMSGGRKGLVLLRQGCSGLLPATRLCLHGACLGQRGSGPLSPSPVHFRMA